MGNFSWPKYSPCLQAISPFLLACQLIVLVFKLIYIPDGALNTSYLNITENYMYTPQATQLYHTSWHSC